MKYQINLFEAAVMTEATNNPQLNNDIDAPHYDRGIVPAETAARKEREGDLFMHIPSKEHDQEAPTDDQTDPESIDTTKGYTVDREGLLNNFAIEPEMYINEPGDLRQKYQEEEMERARELASLQEDERGKLTVDRDLRGKGQGII